MRPIQHLGLLVSSALAVAAMATSLAWAGDRYGPTEGYASSDYGYQASDQSGRTDCDGRDACRADARQFDQRHGAERIDAYGDEGWDRRAEQGRTTYDRRERDTRAYSRERMEDAEQIDPCARQYNLIGHQCLSDGFGYDRGGRVYQDRSWRAERSYADEGDRGAAYGRFDDRAGYGETCEEVHARLGERCPFERRERFERSDLDLRERERGQERVVWVEERLPEEFFFGDGGVGPGIVDFGGGGGGGGGGFVSVDSFASANSSASASAMSSAKAMSMGHQMMMHQMQMHHYPSKMMSHYGGCGCKK